MLRAILALMFVCFALAAAGCEDVGGGCGTGLMRARPRLQITPAVLPDAGESLPYSVQFTASGGTAPYTWSMSGQTPPPGLSLISNGPDTATLVGTPSASGSYFFTITVSDTAGLSRDVFRELRVVTSMLTGAVPASTMPFINASGQMEFFLDVQTATGVERYTVMAPPGTPVTITPGVPNSTPYLASFNDAILLMPNLGAVTTVSGVAPSVSNTLVANISVDIVLP